MLSRLFKPYDVFISYVAEDRETVETLCSGLTAAGLRVWYAKNELYAGAEIRAMIHQGLSSSRYGITLISPLYTSHWAYGEAFFFVSEEKVIPVLHNTTLEEIGKNHPAVIAFYCLETSAGIDQVVTQIQRRIKRQHLLYYAFADVLHFLKKKRRQLLYLLLFFFLLLCTAAAGHWYYSLHTPDEVVETAIRQRMRNVENMVCHELQKDLVQHDGSQSSLAEVSRSISELPADGWKHRNKYSFFNGVEPLQSLSRIKSAGILPVAETVLPPFGLSEYRTYLFKETDGAALKYAFVNLLPLQQYTITNYRLVEGLYEVEVRYKQGLRYADIAVYLDKEDHYHTTVHSFWGIKPVETLVFEKKNEHWEVIQVR